MGGAGDGGIDLWCDEVAIQCKRHEAPQGPRVVRELLGACTAAGARSAVLVSTAGVTRGAAKVAQEHSIVVWDAATLVALAEGEIGLADALVGRDRQLRQSPDE